MQKYLCIFLLVSAFFVENSRSHSKPDLQEHEHVEYKNGDAIHSCEDCRSHSESKDADKEVRDIIRLMQILHRAIDGNGHVHSMRDFFRAFRSKEQWAHLLNVNRMAKRTTRAFNLESHTQGLTDHLKNLIILWPLSHFIEVMTAPVFVAMGTIHGLPSIVVGSGGALLSIIAVPGLDPLCIVLLATYPLKPVHKSIDFVRRVAEGSIKGIITTIRLNVLFSRFYTHEDRFDFIKQKLTSNRKLNKLFRFRFRTFSGGRTLSLFDVLSGDRVFALKRAWDAEKNRFYVRSVWVSRSAPESLPRKFLKLLPWNARAVVREVLDLTAHSHKMESYEGEFFVDKIVANKKGIEVFYRDGAVYLKDKMHLRNGFRSFRKLPCEDSFL